MSMVVTRSPLTAIGMNGAGAAAPKRRSARLSVEGQEDDERPSKKTKVDAAQNAGSSKESGTGKRTRGKGKARDSENRMRQRNCERGDDADANLQFTTTRMAISSSQNVQNLPRKLQPAVPIQRKRPALRSPQ